MHLQTSLSLLCSFLLRNDGIKLESLRFAKTEHFVKKANTTAASNTMI